MPWQPLTPAWLAFLPRGGVFRGWADGLEGHGYLSRASVWLIAACAAARRATGTRNGEQET
jgi:hypothetical protein